MLVEYKRLETEIKELEQKISALPDGKLVISHGTNDAKWYHSDGHKKTYLPKNQRPFAEKLALKKYLLNTINEMKQEQTAIGFYLRHHSTNSGLATQSLLDDTEFQHLLTPHFIPKSTELQQWLKSPYEHNPKHPEHLLHKSSSGHKVRSKSEALIDTFLHMNRIPFRYECSLALGDVIFYPDFTIRHPKTGDFYYWEHFGLMDDAAYIKNAYSKLQYYSLHGIVPFINLITTYETKTTPLSPELILQIIHYYFS